MVYLPKAMEFAASVTSQALATEITLQVDPNGPRLVEIKRVMVKRSAGTATTFQPVIGNVAGFTTDTVNEKYKAASTAVADLLDETNITGFCKTDAAGNLYLRLAPDAGADNALQYAVFILVY